MKGSDNPYPSLLVRESLDDGSDFANPAADYRRLFLGEDGLLRLKDSAGTVTDVGGSVADILDLPTAEMDDTLVLAPDGAGGVEFRAETGGGGGGTIAYPSLKTGTLVDDFDSTLSGWTAVSTAGSFDLTGVFGQAVDGSHLFMPYGGQHGYIYQSTTNIDQEWMVGGIKYGPRMSDSFAGIAILDSSGDGVGMIFHSDNTAALIAVAAGVYTGSPGAQVTSQQYGWAIGTDTPLWLRITRVGNTWTGYASVTGFSWTTATSTMSRTITASRKCIGIFGVTAAAHYGSLMADWVKSA